MFVGWGAGGCCAAQAWAVKVRACVRAGANGQRGRAHLSAGPGTSGTQLDGFCFELEIVLGVLVRVIDSFWICTSSFDTRSPRAVGCTAQFASD